MSKKDFDVYYKRISDQYFEMKKLLDEYELMSMKNLVSPEQIENIKKTIEPIKNNYMTMSHVAYILNTPNRKEKKNKYHKQNKKKLSSIDTENRLDSLVNDNNEQIEKMKGSIDNG